MADRHGLPTGCADIKRDGSFRTVSLPSGKILRSASALNGKLDGEARQEKLSAIISASSRQENKAELYPCDWL